MRVERMKKVANAARRLRYNNKYQQQNSRTCGYAWLIASIRELQSCPGHGPSLNIWRQRINVIVSSARMTTLLSEIVPKRKLTNLVDVYKSTKFSCSILHRFGNRYY